MNQLTSGNCCTLQAVVALSLLLVQAGDAEAADTAGASGASATAATLPDSGDTSGFPDEQRVATLIESLGNPRFVVRREAEQQLLKIGMKAFDQIDAATANPDPEIAASCRYLISELTVHWTRRDDPPQVKELLRDYANADESTRIGVVQALGERIEQGGGSALCRICRYDQSPRVSRQAAVALLQADSFELQYSAGTASQLRQAVGPSVRQPAEWIRLLALQLELPDKAIGHWHQAIAEAEGKLSTSADDELLASQIRKLLQNLARLELHAGNSQGFLQAVDRLVQLSSGSVVDELERFLHWTVASKNPPMVDELLGRYEGQLATSKAGMYLMAIARAEQEQVDVAEKLAERALKMPAAEDGGASSESRLDQAASLIESGHVEWGRRELRAAMDEAAVGSDTHASACLRLADSLHDWQLYQQAADVLKELTDALSSNATLQKQYNNRAKSRSTTGLRPLAEIESYQRFYLACHLKQQGDREGEWDHLERALKLDPTNADIIIAMYRASADDSERRQTVLELIESRCRALEQRIDDQPDYPAWYNVWAWLVSNTEGDFQKAVRYSHKSIDLYEEYGVPKEETAGFLDTLGRCYFAAGDYDKAVKYQSQAVEYKPHLQVLRRQLEEFEQALAAKKSEDSATNSRS